jgi:hypothetical protein
MYLSGQPVAPFYHGWDERPDGSKDLYFGYLNRNWEEEIEIPIGPNNNISAPYGPDAGQPTYFLPRHNRWQFKVHVPAEYGKTAGGELVWTLTTRGETLRAYGSLHPSYVQDEHGRQREIYDTPPEGNKEPQVKVESGTQLTAKVGEPVTLVAVATDDGLPKVAPARGGDDEDAPARGAARRARIGVTGSVGGATGRVQAKGLRFAWYQYRGPAGVTFDPPQFKVWEDPRQGMDSPFSPGWVTPPVPAGNRWVARATFRQPGTYVIRAWADDSYAKGFENVTVTVTR